jgi:hypothetical protein
MGGKPPAFRSRIENALAGLGTSPGDLERALEAMAALADATVALSTGPKASPMLRP